MAFEKLQLTITCLDAEKCNVTFEPLGVTHTLHADDVFHVEYEATSSPDLEVSYIPGGLSVSEFSNAEVRVTNKKGDELPL